MIGPIAYGLPMLAGRSGSGGWRAIASVIALYALVLQAVLGGMMPAHATALDSLLCAGFSESGPVASEKGVPAKAHSHADCCTAAHAPVGAEPPRPESLLVGWSARPILRILWEASEEARPRAPPGLIAHPRGPPAV